MEDKSLSAQNLEAVSGGQIDSCGWNIGEQVSINSWDPRCPDCGEKLTNAGNYAERGYDAFRCRCGKYYVHFYYGDTWNRAIMVP